MKDWASRKHYRDGEAISKRQWEREVFGEGATKPARKRRPKDVAGEFETTEGAVTLTAKQLDFLREVAKLGEDDLLGSPARTTCWGAPSPAAGATSCATRSAASSRASR